MVPNQRHGHFTSSGTEILHQNPPNMIQHHGYFAATSYVAAFDPTRPPPTIPRQNGCQNNKRKYPYYQEDLRATKFRKFGINCA